MKIIEDRRYINTKDFVNENGLEDMADGLFGEGWESEDDCYQIEELLVYCGEEFYDVKFVDGLKSDYDIEVSYNSYSKESHNLNQALVIAKRVMNSKQLAEFHNEIVSRNIELNN